MSLDETACRSSDALEAGSHRTPLREQPDDLSALIEHSSSRLEKAHHLKQFAYFQGNTHHFSHRALRAVHRTHASCAAQDKAARHVRFLAESSHARARFEQGLQLAGNGQNREAAMLLEQSLAENPAGFDLDADLGRMDTRNQPLLSLCARFRFRHRATTTLPFARKPNCLVSDPEQGLLYLSDVSQVHVLAADGAHIESLDLGFFKPRVQCACNGLFWVRDLAEGKRRYACFTSSGDLRTSIAMEDLVPDTRQDYYPLSMCQKGRVNYYLLMLQSTFHSLIVAHDTVTDTKTILASPTDGNYFSFIAANGNELYASDYFSGTVFRYSTVHKEFQPVITVREGEDLQNFAITKSNFFITTKNFISKFSNCGGHIFTQRMHSISDRMDCKLSGCTILNTTSETLLALDIKHQFIYTFEI